MRKPPLQDVIVKQQRGPVPTPQRQGFVRQQQPEHEHSPGRERAQYSGSSYDTDRSVPQFSEKQFPRGRRFIDGESSEGRKWFLIALGVGAVVILCSVALSLVFAGATVTVYPKQDTIVVNTSFSAVPDASQGGAITYQRVTVERTATRNVSAQGESMVEERAMGNITIYNEYSQTPQRLIKRTRFESSSGKIYRISNAVEVPGKSTDGTPGSVEVSVTAEEPGESYNISGPETFSIPGFEGAPQEGLVYAKSTESFEGGFSGIKRTVSEADRSAAIKDLEQQLRNELFSAAFSQADQPQNFHLAKEAVFYEFTTLPDESVENDQVTLSLSGKLHGVLFDKNALARLLARNTIATYNGEDIRIENLNDMSIRVEQGETDELDGTIAPWQASTYQVRAEGKAHFIWEFDEQNLARDLAGKDKGILDAAYEGSLLSSYTGIDRLEATIRPFWKQGFPDDPGDVVIVTKLDE